MGDFNVVLKRGERSGGDTDWPWYMEDMGDCFENAGLEDLRFVGMLLTWFNNQIDNLIWRKLDRAMVNSKWMESFSVAEARFLPSGISDHSPMVVSMCLETRRKIIPFRFFGFWAECVAFFPLVEESWKHNVVGNAMFKLVKS